MSERDSICVPEEKLEVEYRDIPGFVGYQAGSDGTIWSVGTNWRGKGRRQMVAHVDDYGYLRLRLGRDGSRIKKAAHYLIAITFIGPRPSVLHEVRHGDGNKLNNSAVNLCWGTAKQNAEDRDRHGTTATGERNGARLRPERLARGDRNGTRVRPEKVARGERQGCAKLTGELVLLARSQRAAGKTWKQIAEPMGVNPTTVRRAVVGEAWRHV